MKRLLIIFCILLTLCSCSSAAVDSEHNNDFSEQNSDRLSEGIASYEEVSELYPDKTVLVWAVEGYIGTMRTTEINQYLDSLGCDFAVCFLPVKDTAVSDQISEKSHLQLVEDMTKNNERIDIVYSSNIFIGIDDCTDSFHRLIDDGLLLCLDDYLNNTEAGKRLYSLMPEKHWEGLKSSGHIYGVDGSMNTLSYYTGYSIDKTIADKYGYDVNVSPIEQLDILAEIAKEHTVCYPQSFSTPSTYAPVYSITSAVYWDNSQNKAKCILENEGFLRNLEMYYALMKNGFVFESDGSNPFIYFEGNRHGSASAIAGDRYCEFDRTVYITPTWSANGISVNSKHPDKAFELLALAQTNPVLNNLLVYGLEGEDYTIIDGKACGDDRRFRLRADVFANKLICLPDEYSPANASETYRDTLENAELVSCTGFWFDEKEMFQTVQKTDCFFLLNEFGKLLNNGEYESFDALIQACKDKLDEYGMKELLTEINRQYEEWANENN